MVIDRQHVKDTFQAYADNYNAEDEKIKLKIFHTYRVADIAERIAKSLGLCDEDIELAWLMGMLHDVGRFEQLRIYNTFRDADSVNHAQFGADLLFREGLIRSYISDDSADCLIETAIRQHNGFRVEETLDERTKQFCHILRDADKIDILRVNVEVPAEEIHNTTTEILRSSPVTDAVMEQFYEHHAIMHSTKRSVVDHIVGYVSLVFELVYPESLVIVNEQGYLDQIMHFQSENADTMQRFAEIREEMERYLTKNC